MSIRRQRWNLGSEAVMANFTECVMQMRLAGKRPIVEFVPEKRSLDQNALIYAMYQQIAAQIEDQSITDVRHECKLRFGVPILRAENEKFRALYDKSIKHTLSYEEKLDAMELLPVTRLMTKGQAARYVDEIIREYSKQGVSIIFPGEEFMQQPRA